MDDLFANPFEEDAPEAEPARPAPTRRAPERRIFSVGELTAAIRGTLESAFGDVWVEGELSNCRAWNSGHFYFTLKEDGAQIKAVMFRSAVRYLRFTPEDGLRVIARGRLGVYEPKGEYQIVCEHLEPHGLGALQLAFEQLKKRLQAEGLFDAARKRPLPRLPRRIGVVTSLDGAALRDIIKVLRRRHPNAHLVIAPARVQGEGAAAEIARGLRQLGRVEGVDVIIVGRGGGSVEDLQAFNEERVARAIAACPVPVISAVGHEVDVTIADFVADVRAATPSAAAEVVVAAREEFCARIDRLTDRLRGAMRTGLQQRRGRVHVLASRRGLAAWPARLALRGRHAAELAHELRSAVRRALARRDRTYRALRLRLETRDLRRQLAGMRARLATTDGRLAGSIQRVRHRSDARFRALAGRLENLSPLAVLARGYAVCWNADGTAVLRRATDVTPGAHVRVTLHEGELHCSVDRTTLNYDS
ncbi:MAG TPA: exodeoxyribonuclease VII large subunit [Vicinamibacterales bacterium]|nr:exodeoxyribonuclease VII large subunit [Vicinamibacterales bacterium]